MAGRIGAPSPASRTQSMGPAAVFRLLSDPGDRAVARARRIRCHTAAASPVSAGA